MPGIKEGFDAAFRDHVVDGVAASGVQEPDKAEVRALGQTIEEAVSALALVAGGAIAVVYATQAELFADLAHDADLLGLVYNDPDPLKSGYYVKVGASGTGSWTLTDIPYAASLAAVEAAVQPMVDAAEAAQAAAEAAAADAAADAAFVDDRPGLDAFAIGDADGNVVLVVTPDEVRHAQIDQMAADVAAGAVATAAVGVRAGPDLVAIGDADGNAILLLDKDRVRHPYLDATRQSARRALLLSGLEAGLHNIISFGQSLSVGAFSTPPLTTTARSDSYRFVGGARITDAGTDIPTILGSIVPFLETAISGYGETPLGGMIAMIAQLLREEDDIDLDDERVRFVLGASGTTGTSAAALLAGAAMDRAEGMIAYGLTSGEAAGLTYEGCAAIAYIQGEQDYVENTDPTAWKASVRQIRANLDAQNLTTLGRSRKVTMFAYQLSTHLALGRATPSIALALLELESEAHCGRVTPTYNLPYYGGDQIHLTNKGSLELGARIGLQIKRRLIDRVAGPGIRAGTAQRSGATVTIPISGAVNGLVQDTTPGSVANLGFTLIDNVAAAMTIDSAVITGDSVVLTASATVPAGSEWRYGWVGNAYRGYGQIRDNDETVFLGPDGLIYRLQNWLPISKGAIA